MDECVRDNRKPVESIGLLATNTLNIRNNRNNIRLYLYKTFKCDGDGGDGGQAKADGMNLVSE